MGKNYPSLFNLSQTFVNIDVKMHISSPKTAILTAKSNWLKTNFLFEPDVNVKMPSVGQNILPPTPQQTWYIDSMLFYCWASVVDDGPILYNVSTVSRVCALDVIISLQIDSCCAFLSSFPWKNSQQNPHGLCCLHTEVNCVGSQPVSRSSTINITYSIDYISWTPHGLTAYRI